MRSLLIVASILTLVATPSVAQKQTPEGVARTVSLAFFVGEICSNYFNVDKEITKDLSLAAAKMGNDLVGIKPFGKIASKEITRRAKEIDATGAKMWCTYQKPYLTNMGLKAFLD